MTGYVLIKVEIQESYNLEEILNEANYEVSYLDGNNQVIENSEMVDVFTEYPFK
jgi:hypothetical protein